MSMPAKNILIIDEARFSRVCSAILELEGYAADSVVDGADLRQHLDTKQVGLIIASYPSGVSLLESVKQRDIPTIVLSDHISKDLIWALGSFLNSYCMIKPLDYQKFRALVNQVMNAHDVRAEGCHVV